MQQENSLRKELEKIKESLENILKDEDKLNLVSRKELAKILNCSKNTIINHEKAGIIKPLKIGRIVRYNLEEVLRDVQNTN